MEKDNCGVGMIANLRKEESHRIVKNALQVIQLLLLSQGILKLLVSQVLERMAHRGGCGCEVNTGDGSGILVTIPDTFYRAKLKQQGITLPPKGEYGTGLIFFSQKQAVRDQCKAIIEKHCAAKGFDVLAWRDVPTDNRSRSAFA